MADNELYRRLGEPRWCRHFNHRLHRDGMECQALQVRGRAAEAAANEARQAMRASQTLSDFSAAIAMVEEIRRLHRVEQPNLYQFLERYSAARTALIGVRKLSPALSDSIQTQIQSAIMTMTMTTIESIVERARVEGGSPDFVELNHLLSVGIDGMHAVLIDMTLAGKQNP